MRVALVREGVVDSIAVVGAGFSYPHDELTLVELSEGQTPAPGDRYDPLTGFSGAAAADSPLAVQVQQLLEVNAVQQDVLDALVSAAAER